MRPPVDFEPVTRDAETRVDRPLHIQAVEGRPSGLVLRFWCTCEVSAGMWLEVLRKTGDAPAERIRRVRLDERLSARLAADGFEFLDRSVPVEASTTYQVRLRASEDDAPAQILTASETLTLTWQAPPERPDEVRATSEIAGTVELVWSAPAGTGALIFRRDVLDADARPERLARLGPQARASFVDRDAKPGGVYAYQVALAVKIGAVKTGAVETGAVETGAVDTRSVDTRSVNPTSTVQFGPPSDEIYVTVRAAPRDSRQSRKRR